VATDTAAVRLDCRTSDTAAVSVACYTLATAELSQFVLSRSFKQCCANAWLAQWSRPCIGPARPKDRFPVSFIFFYIFATQLLMYYDIAAYSVFAIRQLYYDIATYSVYCRHGRASSLLHVRGTAAVSAVVNLINDTAPVSLSSAYCLCVGHVFTKFTDATSNNALPTGLNCSLACILF